MGFPKAGKGKGKHAKGKAGGEWRKRISGKRFEGTVESWRGTWGFLATDTAIKHPDAKPDGRVYVRAADFREGEEPFEGDAVDFLVYADSRGLGAEDVRIRPTAEEEDEEEEDENAPLPEGWEKHYSVENQEYYYWHVPTTATQWTRPREEGPLPPGWSKQYDRDLCKWYYWHAPTKTTQWERPMTAAAKASAAAAKAKAEAEAEEEGEEAGAEERGDAAAEAADPAKAPVLGQQRLQGIVTKWHGFFGEISPLGQLSPDLRSLIEKNQDKVCCNWRDVQDGVKLKVGCHVSFMLYVDDNGLGASAVRLYEEGEEEDEAEAEPEPTTSAKQQRRGGRGFRGGKRAAKVAAAEDEEEGASGFGVAEAAATEEDQTAPLLPGWEQHWSEEHQCPFYWHREARQAAWERPAIPIEVDDEEAAEEEDDSSGKVWAGEGAESGAAALTTPMTPLLAGQAGRKMTPITPTTSVRSRISAPSAGFRAAAAAGVFRGVKSEAGSAGGPAKRGSVVVAAGAHAAKRARAR